MLPLSSNLHCRAITLSGEEPRLARKNTKPHTPQMTTPIRAAAHQIQAPGPLSLKINSQHEKIAPVTSAPAIKPPVTTGTRSERRETGRSTVASTGTNNRAAWLRTITANHNQYGQYE